VPPEFGTDSTWKCSLEERRTMANENSEKRILVTASPYEVDEYLKSALMPEEYHSVSVTAPARSSKLPGQNRGIDPDTALAIINFTAAAVASGLIYDLVKKVVIKLTERFGSDRIIDE
jgi:hypothetical protein